MSSLSSWDHGVLVYLDDVLIYLRTLKEHHELLR